MNLVHQIAATFFLILHVMYLVLQSAGMRDCWSVLCCIRSARLHDLNMPAVHPAARWLPNTDVKLWGESWVWTPDLPAWQSASNSSGVWQPRVHFMPRINSRQSTFAHMPVCKRQLCYLMTWWPTPIFFLQSVWSYWHRMITLLHWYSSALCVSFLSPVWRILTLRIALPIYFVGWW